MKKSISRKLLVGILTPVVIGLVGLAVITMFLSSAAIIKLANEDLRSKSLEANYHVDGYFKEFISSVETVSKTNEIIALFNSSNRSKKMNNNETFTEVKNNLNSYSKINKDILGYWVADIDGSQLVYNDGTTTNSSWRIDDRPWYKQLVASDLDSIVTSPYVDSGTGKDVVTIVTFAKNSSGKNIGAVGIDLNIATLKEHLSEFKMGNTGHFVFVAEDNKIVFADGDRASFIGKKVDDVSELDQKIRNISKTDYVGDFEFEDASGHVMAYKTTSEFTGWSTYSALPVKEFKSAITTLIMTCIIVGIVVLAILVLVIILIARSITRPIRRLNEVAIEIADGKLDSVIDVNSKDEIGVLADSLRKTVESLNEYVIYIDKTSNALNMIADGDLTFEASTDGVNGAFLEVVKGFINIKNRLSHTMETVKVSSDQINMAADELAVGAQNLSQSSVEQASSTQELSATIADVTNAIQSNAEFVDNANGVAKNALVNVNNGSEQMNKLILAMDDVKDSSSEIEKIIKTIEDIAFQTNILALNAAVEAARAGDAGKGFAVVADEVRNLAVKSAEAAKNTNKLIGNTLESINEGNTVLDATVSSLDEIIKNVDNLAELIEKINEANKLQAQAAEQIENGIEQISSAVQTNSATAEETAASSEELSSQSKIMNDMMNEFKLDVE